VFLSDESGLLQRPERGREIGRADEQVDVLVGRDRHRPSRGPRGDAAEDDVRDLCLIQR
jgi:hypothetical protein